MQIAEFLIFKLSLISTTGERNSIFIISILLIIIAIILFLLKMITKKKDKQEQNDEMLENNKDESIDPILNIEDPDKDEPMDSLVDDMSDIDEDNN